MPIHTTHTRDAALRELGRLNRWLVSGSLVLTAVFAEAAAHAFPGKKTKPASTTSTSTSARTHVPAKTSMTHPLQPPAQAPRTAAESHSSTTQSAPAQESEPAPAQEPTPAHESTPSQEAAPAQESEPAQEAAPPTGSAPAPEPEASAPVVSGGS